MNKVIFLGGFFPKELEREIIDNSKNVIQVAANNFQLAFIKGLEFHLKNNLFLITAPFIGYYPFFYKKLFFKARYFEFLNEKNGICVGFINLPIIKNFAKYVNLFKQLNKLVKSEPNSTIIIYSLNWVYLKAAIEIQKKHKSVKICLIVPDLPEFPSDSTYLYRLYIRLFENNRVNKLLKSVDGFVFLTEMMNQKLNKLNKPYVVIEGLYDDNQKPVEKSTNSNDFFTILYTGSLDNRSGIVELLEAFSLLKKEKVKLVICGSGTNSNVVESASNVDDRIIYLGNLEVSEVRDLQANADLLINPRKGNEEFTKYSFPSKTMEYFASGTATLMYRLPGVPAVYFDYCYVIEGDAIEDLHEAIFNLSNSPKNELIQKGSSARKFIFNNKTAIDQTSKVLENLSKLFNS